MRKNEWAVWIGRFQPFHNGHERVLNFIRSHHENIILILGEQKKHDPFTEELRKAFFTLLLEEKDFRGIKVISIKDSKDWHEWATNVATCHTWHYPNSNLTLVKPKKLVDTDKDGFHYLDFLTGRNDKKEVYFKKSLHYSISERNALSATDIRKCPKELIKEVHPYLRELFQEKLVEMRTQRFKNKP
jgi:cytidyltransferase-like protein